MEATTNGEGLKPIDKMTLAEIATELHRRLRAMSQDRNPEHNPILKAHITKFYYPVAKPAGRYVALRYRMSGPNSSLTKSQAGEYLHWLRCGNFGTHDDARRFFERKTEA